MSTRVSQLYVEHDTLDGKRSHSFHIYREAFTGEYYVVDDFERSPVRISEAAAKEICDAFGACSKGFFTRDG